MIMITPAKQIEDGGTIIVVLSVVATILALLGSAVAYTQHVSRVLIAVAKRPRRSKWVMATSNTFSPTGGMFRVTILFDA